MLVPEAVVEATVEQQVEKEWCTVPLEVLEEPHQKKRMKEQL